MIWWPDILLSASTHSNFAVEWKSEGAGRNFYIGVHYTRLFTNFESLFAIVEPVVSGATFCMLSWLFERKLQSNIKRAIEEKAMK